MGFLDRLFGRSAERDVLWLYVRCNQCGAKVRVRVNTYNDLSLVAEGGYILRKEIMDSQCCRLMHAELLFDSRRRVTSRDISGGEFITKEAFEATEEAT